MNILQILPELNVGGVETGTVDFAKYLNAQGHKSIVVSNGGALVADLEAGGSKHYTLPVHKKNLFTAIHCIKKLVEIIRAEKIDIVHARSRIPAWIGFFASRQTEAHFITTCHGYYSQHFFSRVMGWGKMVIAISEVIGRHMVQDFNVPAENIRVIARSVDVSRFSLPRPPKSDPESLTITMVGRITPLKGHPYFLKAMALVVRQLPKVKIQIIGDAPLKKQAYKEELLLLTKRLGLSEHVEFMGNRRDIPELLSKSDCLVLSTITQEAFGRVIIEAQAAGVPVVATRVGGVSEIIDHEKTGLLVLPKDEQAMAQAVVRLLTHRDFAQSLVVQARKKIDERYTLRHMAEATLDVYRELMRSMSILVVKLTAVGDVVLITAALKALRAKFPQAHIYCLTAPEASPVLQRCPYLTGIIIFDPKDKKFAAICRMGRELRRYRFDKVIDLQNNRISHWLSFLAAAKDSYGYHNGKFSFLLSKKIKNDIQDIPPVEHQFRVLGMLGIDYHPDLGLELWPSLKDEEYVQGLLESEWLDSKQPFIGLNMSASIHWPTKNWPVEHMARFCDILGAKNIRVVLTGQDKDKPLVRQLIAKAKAKPASFVGKTNIMQLAALIKRCKVYVGPDSAPLHVAASQAVPVIALFGPTDPKRHMPPVAQGVIVNKSLKCSPCYAGVCKINTHACMKDITPEEVAKQVFKFLK